MSAQLSKFEEVKVLAENTASLDAPRRWTALNKPLWIIVYTYNDPIDGFVVLRSTCKATANIMSEVEKQPRMQALFRCGFLSRPLFLKPSGWILKSYFESDRVQMQIKEGIEQGKFTVFQIIRQELPYFEAGRLVCLQDFQITAIKLGFRLPEIRAGFTEKHLAVLQSEIKRAKKAKKKEFKDRKELKDKEKALEIQKAVNAAINKTWKILSNVSIWKIDDVYPGVHKPQIEYYWEKLEDYCTEYKKEILRNLGYNDVPEYLLDRVKYKNVGYDKFSALQFSGILAGFTKQDVESEWFSDGHLRFAHRGFLVEELRGVKETNLRFLSAGLDKSLVESVVDSDIARIDVPLRLVYDMNSVQRSLVEKGIPRQTVKALHPEFCSTVDIFGLSNFIEFEELYSDVSKKIHEQHKDKKTPAELNDMIHKEFLTQCGQAVSRMKQEPCYYDSYLFSRIRALDSDTVNQGIPSVAPSSPLGDLISGASLELGYELDASKSCRTFEVFLPSGGPGASASATSAWSSVPAVAPSSMGVGSAGAAGAKR